ncbi:MAG TPA: hypothetical protein VHA15_08195 [Burkholderiales bacterium]|nr:hypothetical protein [Burkholderiales bacterium]
MSNRFLAPRRWLSRLGGALLMCGAAGLAVAHSESDATGGYALIDCEHPGPKVATELPAEIAASGILQCTPSMHMIVANGVWNWRYPGSFFDRPFIPAHAPKASQGQAGARFFTRFETRELNAEQIRARHEQFAAELPTYPDTAPPARMLQLVAINDLGHELDAYYGFRSERDGWVVLCTPACATENMFLIEKAD